MQFCVIGHSFEVPLQAFQGYSSVLMTGVSGSFRFQTARGPWPAAMAQLRFGTNLGDDYMQWLSDCF